MKQNRLSLSVSFQGPPAVIDHAWLRLEQTGLKPATASIGETADLVDAAYRTDSCQASATAGPVDQGKFREVVRQTFDLSLCDTSPNGDTRTQIKIISSNPAAPYGLRFSGPAAAVQTVIVDEEITLRLKVENSDSIVLPWPVTGAADFSWSGSVFGPGGMIIAPEITKQGTTLSFDAPLTGVIAATYQTRYRLVDVVVISAAECRALCFSLGLVAELDIQRPESQGTLSDWQKYCNPQNEWVFPVPDITCYEDVEKSWRCECATGQESRSATVKETVPCPDGFAEWGMEPGEHKIGDRYEIAGYEHCPDLQTHPWADDISDPDYYTKICCNPPPKGLSLPTCKTKTSANPGGVSIENGSDYYMKLYGPGTKIVPVSPADGDCGTMETIQEVTQKNCCDGVAPIYWDYANSAEVIADNSKGLVKVTGGQAPYTWQIRGSGFWADAAHTARDVQTNGPYLWIYADSSCGPCDIYVSDGCSSTSGGVKSTIGQWVTQVQQLQPTHVEILSQFTYFFDNLYHCYVVPDDNTSNVGFGGPVWPYGDYWQSTNYKTRWKYLGCVYDHSLGYSSPIVVDQTDANTGVQFHAVEPWWDWNQGEYHIMNGLYTHSFGYVDIERWQC